MAQWPWCPEPLETKPHIVWCQKPPAQQVWTKSMADLAKCLRGTQNTDLWITQQLLAALNYWYNEILFPMGSYPILEAQAQIEQEYLINGWLSSQQCSMQEQYWAQIRLQKSSKCWLTEILKRLWNASWDLWDHCNEALHNMEVNWHTILEIGINQSLCKIYSQGPLALPWMALPLLKQPLETCLKKTLHQSVQLCKFCIIFPVRI